MYKVQSERENDYNNIITHYFIDDPAQQRASLEIECSGV